MVSLRFDPWLIISQIVSIQSLHYITLSLILPPLLVLFTDPIPLSYHHGGPATVGMIMDWREMAGRPTLGPGVGGGSWNPFEGWDGVVRVPEPPEIRKGTGGWSKGMHPPGATPSEALSQSSAEFLDPARAWTIAVAWLIACGVDIYYLYTLVRRPTYILDFALTLVMNHLILTTYYASFPSSLFFWVIMITGAVFTIVLAEQLCVRREMREGLGVSDAGPIDPSAEEEVLAEQVELLERGG